MGLVLQRRNLSKGRLKNVPRVTQLASGESELELGNLAVRYMFLPTHPAPPRQILLSSALTTTFVSCLCLFHILNHPVFLQ